MLISRLKQKIDSWFERQMSRVLPIPVGLLLVTPLVGLIVFAGICDYAGSQAVLKVGKFEWVIANGYLGAPPSDPSSTPPVTTPVAASVVTRPSPAAVVEANVRARWNASVGYGNPDNFGWTGVYFPHPTFRGGSIEAYEKFAGTLVSFLERGDNFEYLDKNNQFTSDLYYGIGQKTDFLELVEKMSKPKSMITDEVLRTKLVWLAAKIKSRVLPPV